MSYQEFAKLWEDAIAQYNTTVGPGESIGDRTGPMPQSVGELLEMIEHEHGKFSAFRERQAKFRLCLKYALAPVEILCSLVSGAASTAFPPTGMVFGAVMFLLGTAKNVGSAYDGIADLFTRIGDFTRRLEVHAQQDIPEGLRRILFEILNTLLDIMALSTKRIHDGRLKKFLDCALLGRDSKIDAAVGRLDRLINSELLMTSAETLAQVNHSVRVLDHVETSNAEIRKIVQNIEDETRSAQSERIMQQVRDSLNPEVATFEVFEKAKDELLKDSGLWILDEELFSAWMNGKIPLLFIYGSPGAGKSFLSCQIIQTLGQVHPQGVQDASRVSIAYFFCKNNASGLRSHRSILLTIAYQIAKKDPTYAKHVARLQIFIQDCRSITSLWQTLFIEFFKRKECRSSALIVLDGLDEADEEERPRFLKLMSALYASENKAHSKLQVILVGRPEIIEELDDALGFLPPKIEINPAKNSNDIRRYIENTVMQSKLIRRRPKALRDEIVEKLSAGANGFFLWASLMLQEIEKASRSDVIRKTLNNLPKGLTEALRQVVTRYSETMETEEIDDLNHILSWVLYAQRPLYLRELGDSLRIRTADGLEVYDLEGKINKYASFFTLTNARGGSIEKKATLSLEKDGNSDTAPESVRVDSKKTTDRLTLETLRDPHSDDEDDDDDDDGDDDDDDYTEYPKLKVSVRHASITEFFKGKDQDEHRSIHVDGDIAQIQILKTCLRVYCDLELLQSCDYQDGLVRYAEYAFEHLPLIDLSKVNKEEKLEIGMLLIQLFRDEETVKRWVHHNKHVLQKYLLDQSDFVTALHRWYKDTDVREQYEAEDPTILPWLNFMISAPIKEQLRPVALACARDWLQVDNWNYDYEISFLRQYLQMVSEFRKTSESTDHSKCLTPTVVEIARWAEFEETPDWCLRVGFTLADDSEFDEAIEFLQKSLRGGKGDGIALCTMADCYAKVNDLEKAIETAKLGISLLSEDQAYMTDWAYYYLTRFYFDLGQVDGFLESGSSLLDQIETCGPGNALPNYLAWYLTALIEVKQNKHAVEVIQRVMTFRYSPRFFRRLIFDEILNLRLCGLASDENCVELVGEFYERGLHVLSSDDNDDDPDDLVLQPIFRSWYGILLLRATSDDEKAIKTLERTLNDFEAVKVTGDVRFIRDCAENELQMRYLCKALRARSSGDSSGADDFALRLSDIVHRGDSSNNSRLSTLVLAVWERTEKREDVARKLIQPAIAMAIDMLTDDTDENGLQAWDSLSYALAASGDVLNAIAALFFTKQFKEMVKRRGDLIPKPAVEEPGPEEVVSEGSNAEGAVSEEGFAQITGSEGTDKDSKGRTTSYYWCTCDGCFKRLSTRRIQYRCSNCLSTDFCAFCHQLLLGGQLKQNICDQSHEFLCIPAVTGPLPEGKIRVDNQDIAIKDWLDGLKRQWDL